MKKPGWVKFVAVSLILIGMVGFVSGTAKFGWAIAVSNMDDTTLSQSENPDIPQEFEGKSIQELQNKLDEATNTPEWYKDLRTPFSLIQAILGFSFIVIGIMLFKLKSSSIKASYIVLGASIFVAVAHLVMVTSSGSFHLLFSSPGLAFGLVVDAVIILMIILCDKSAFENTPMSEQV